MKLTVTNILAVILALSGSALLLGDASWEGDFDPITLPDITTQDAIVDGDSTRYFDLTEDVEMSADNSTTAQLYGPDNDRLTTRYQLTFDGDGVTASGASNTTWTGYSEFLNPPITITHVPGDDSVRVRLHARAQNRDYEVANAGLYTATQTLTVTWTGE